MSGDAFISGSTAMATQALASGRMNAVHGQPAAGKGVKQAADEFASVFMAQMLQPMMEGLEVDGMFGGGHGEEIMRGFLVQEYGKSMASAGFGFSNAVMAEMIRMQEKGAKAKEEGI